MTNKQAARKLSGIMTRLSVLRIETDRIRSDFIGEQSGKSAKLLTEVNSALNEARPFLELAESKVTDAWHLLYRT